MTTTHIGGQVIKQEDAGILVGMGLLVLAGWAAANPTPACRVEQVAGGCGCCIDVSGRECCSTVCDPYGYPAGCRCR